MTEEEEHDRKLLERLSMFNDAVYAIVLTILVLELHLPDLANATSLHDMGVSLRILSPKLMAFFLSVLLVGGSWLSSVNLQKVLTKTNSACLILSVIYLIIISLFPFCCDVIGTYPDNPGSYLIFGVLSIAMTANAYLWMHLNVRDKLLHKKADYKEWKKLMNTMPFVFPYLIAVSLSAFISTRLSFILFLLTNILPFVLTRKVKINHEN